MLARIAETFYIPTYRLRCQSADLLSALCVLSPHEGHGLVLAALSEVKGPHDNLLRFQWLVNSLDPARGLQDDASGSLQGEVHFDGGIWDWRVAALGLLNAIANTPDGLEERCALRGELDRRGLNTALEVRLTPLSSRITLIPAASTSGTARILHRTDQSVRGRMPRRLGRDAMAQPLRSGGRSTCCSSCSHSDGPRRGRRRRCHGGPFATDLGQPQSRCRRVSASL